MTIFEVYKYGTSFVVVCTRDDGSFYGEVFSDLNEVKQYIYRNMVAGDEYYFRW